MRWMEKYTTLFDGDPKKYIIYKLQSWIIVSRWWANLLELARSCTISLQKVETTVFHSKKPSCNLLHFSHSKSLILSVLTKIYPRCTWLTISSIRSKCRMSMGNSIRLLANVFITGIVMSESTRNWKCWMGPVQLWASHWWRIHPWSPWAGVTSW